MHDGCMIVIRGMQSHHTLTNTCVEAAAPCAAAVCSHCTNRTTDFTLRLRAPIDASVQTQRTVRCAEPARTQTCWARPDTVRLLRDTQVTQHHGDTFRRVAMLRVSPVCVPSRVDGVTRHGANSRTSSASAAQHVPVAATTSVDADVQQRAWTRTCSACLPRDRSNASRHLTMVQAWSQPEHAPRQQKLRQRITSRDWFDLAAEWAAQQGWGGTSAVQSSR